MDDRIKASFDAVHASQAMKEQTMRAVRQHAASAKRPARRWRLTAAAFAAAALIILSGWLWMFPTAAVSIDVNPSLELSVNRFGYVVQVQGWNEDGEQLADGLNIRFMPVSRAVETVLARQEIQDCLAREEELCIAVAATREGQQQALLDAVQQCAGSGRNIYCGTADYSLINAAHECGLSFGKYRAYLELAALDPTLTPRQAAQMTMRELRDRIEQLGGDTQAIPGGGYGQGKGQGNGQGAQHGREKGQN